MLVLRAKTTLDFRGQGNCVVGLLHLDGDASHLKIALRQAHSIKVGMAELAGVLR
jgi:hypothetical protein